MATWVRSFTGDLTGSSDTDLSGPADLDTDTSPADFDEAAVNSVRFQFTLSHTGTFASGTGSDDYTLQNVEIQTSGSTQLAAIAASGTIQDGSATVVIDTTDNSPNNGASVADWEGARFDAQATAIAVFNQVKGPDGVAARILAASVTITIDYEPATSQDEFGSGAITETHTVVGTGDKEGIGSGASTNGHTVVGTGTSARSDAGSITHGHTVVATGFPLEVHSGSGSITETHTVVGAGDKEGIGTGSISHGHTVVATGVKDASGTGSITETHTVVGTGDQTAALPFIEDFTAPVLRDVQELQVSSAI